ncbi:hypothetical protein [Maribacter sp. 2307ULW6-5]|uniref:hypothetical protein n=1 Tax=Maribacter sp. 2307ULW6-5 TaxID=3386275 RepID=UPI0039BD7897
MSTGEVKMRMERSAINIYLVLFLFFASKSFCQHKIQGTYSTPIIFGYEQFVFKENGVFEYRAGADLGDSQYGKGHYELSKDSLILRYDLTKLPQESYFRAKKYYNSKDSVEVCLHIYSFDKEPLYNITVYSSPGNQSTESNEQGAATLKFPKGAKKDMVEIDIDGEFWAKQTLYLNADANYLIDVFMNKSTIQGFGHPKALKHQTLRYGILEFKDTGMTLKGKEGTFDLIKSN